MNSLHYKYWIGILIFIIVLIITATWSEVQNLADKLSFALTITSVILEILAIYFTVSFNAFFSKNIITFLSLNEGIQSSAAKLSKATEGLSQKLDMVPEAFHQINQKIDGLTSESMQAMMTDQEVKNIEVDHQGIRDLEWNDRNISEFFVGISFVGMLCLFLVAQCRFKGRHINIDDFETKIPMISNRFFAGFSTACGALNLFEVEKVGEVLVIKTCQEKLVEKAEYILDKVLAVDTLQKELFSNMQEAKLAIVEYTTMREK